MTCLVVATIYTTLFMGRPLANELRDQNVQAVFFVLGMFLVACAVVFHGIKNKPGKVEMGTITGLIALYVMLIFRLGAPERSHLIKYSILAIFTHRALLERASFRKLAWPPSLLAFLLAFLFGIVDESIQIILPNRTFDPQDIIFNAMAALGAIMSSLFLTWSRHMTNKEKADN